RFGLGADPFGGLLAVGTGAGQLNEDILLAIEQLLENAHRPFPILVLYVVAPRLDHAASAAVRGKLDGMVAIGIVGRLLIGGHGSAAWTDDDGSAHLDRDLRDRVAAQRDQREESDSQHNRERPACS